MAYGDELVTLVAIDQPLCTHVWGDAFFSPSGGCPAVLGVDAERKCWNGRASCPVPDSYSPGTLTLLFAKSQQGLAQYGYVIPSLESIETTPGSINLASMDRSASALGQREVVTLRFKDHLHSDLLVDKYRLERKSGAAQSDAVGYDPYTRGTFWGKWLARNPYHSAYALRVYRGTMGQALADMEVRHYIIDRIDGPNGGRVTVVAKDKFSRIEARKAVAPTASRGELLAGISAVDTSFTVTPPEIVEEDYPPTAGSPSELFVAIGDEIIKCTRAGGVFTAIQRGANNTTAEAHNAEDLVQWVLAKVAMLPHDIIYDLLTDYGGIDPADIDQADWDEQAEEVTILYTGYIAEPTPVNQLVGEICEGAGLTVWPDVRTGDIKLRALRSRSPIATVDEEAWLVEGSLETRRLNDRRVSQVWVYYGKKNPVEDQEDPRNYYSRLVSVDPTAEADDQYAAPKIHVIFSRWIPQFGRASAEDTADRILTIFRDPPLEAQLQLDRGREGEVEVTDYIALESARVQDMDGDTDSIQMAVTAMKRGDGRIDVTALQISFEAIEGEEAADRTIYIENDSYNLNLRTIHDSLYAEPPAGSPSITIRFVVQEGVTVGSTSTSSPAMRTGSWTNSPVLILENHGRIQGMGGTGGAGHAASAGNGENGHTGGDALLVEYATTLDNSDGQLWGGAGGGGGSPGSDQSGTLDPGSGGGGGAGTNGGTGGAAGGVGAGAGSAGSANAGGAGGDIGGGGNPGTRGGDGGAPGLSGSAGNTDSGSLGSAGSGGAPGNYINGIALVTFVGSPIGDVRGAVA